MIDNDTDNRFKNLIRIFSARYIIGFILFAGIASIFVVACMKKWWLYSLLIYILGKEELDLNNILKIEGLLTIAIGAIVIFANKLLEWSVSQKRKDKYRQKREQHYKKIFELQ